MRGISLYNAWKRGTSFRELAEKHDKDTGEIVDAIARYLWEKGEKCVDCKVLEML